VNDQIFFNDRKIKLSQFGHYAFFSQKISENEKLTEVFDLFRPKDRNVSAKRKIQAHTDTRGGGRIDCASAPTLQIFAPLSEI